MEPPSQPQEVSHLLEALKDAVGLFTELHIPYALVGGLAAMIYGRARFTEDADFVAAANHLSILAANPDTVRRFHFDPASTWKLYHASGISIDIWKDENSDAIAARAKTIELRGLTLRIAEVHDLIAMKLRANRPQDDYDISEIVRVVQIQEPAIAAQVSSDELARFRQIRARIAK